MPLTLCQTCSRTPTVVGPVALAPFYPLRADTAALARSQSLIGPSPGGEAILQDYTQALVSFATAARARRLPTPSYRPGLPSVAGCRERLGESKPASIHVVYQVLEALCEGPRPVRSQLAHTTLHIYSFGGSNQMPRASRSDKCRQNAKFSRGQVPSKDFAPLRFGNSTAKVGLSFDRRLSTELSSPYGETCQLAGPPRCRSPFRHTSSLA